MAGLLKSLSVGGKKTLLLTPKADRTVWLAGRNLQAFAVRDAVGFSTADVVNAEVLLIQKSALTQINERLQS
jgi:ribosomal protein L4